MKHYPIVQVNWVDSCGNSRWAPLEEHQRSLDSFCVSVGYLLKSNRHQITLVQSLDTGVGNADNSISIPRCSVRSVERLGKAKFPEQNKGGKK